MAKDKIRLLIVDDHAVVRKGLVMVLKLEPDFEVTGECGDGREALLLAAQIKPDIVLLDRMMPGLDGQATALQFRAAYPEIKLLILTGTAIDQGVLDLLAAGVDGYLTKDVEPHELKQAIRAIYAGEAYLHPAVARQVLERMKQPPSEQPDVRLTGREAEVLTWLVTPLTYRQIADTLKVSEETIRSHAKSILNKLNQPNRAQAVLAAMRLGLLEPPKNNEIG